MPALIKMAKSLRILRFVTISLLALSANRLFSQGNIRYNSQQLFLNGANLAWMSFGNDVGPGPRDFTAFGDILLQMHNHGGNSLRWWIHANGAVSPAFNDTGLVVGPGAGTIESLRKALDIAWQREIGVALCLWSFDMLRATNSPSVVARNLKLLTDTAYVSAYITTCLIPMIDSLKGHPAIVAWEIFNEPEGMSDEFYFDGNDPHVSMSTIERFVNLCAGAIHRRDSTALVTSGAWSFKSLTDVSAGTLAKTGGRSDQFSSSERQQLLRSFNRKYGFAFSAEEFDAYLQRIQSPDNHNYYSDSRLVAAGGDSKGTLDFYSVHYFEWGGTTISPFHHQSAAWQLDKPIVVGEFDMKDTYGVLKENLYPTLFRNGYAGALAWSWTDAAFSSRDDILAGMRSLWDDDRSSVDVHGVGQDWAIVTITGPKNDSMFASSASVTVQSTAVVIDDGRVVLVEFFANDTLKIGERGSAPFAVTWSNPPEGSYTLTAVATGNLGHRSTSNRVRIQVGPPSIVRLEAEAALKEGDIAHMFVRSLQTASGGAYLELRTASGKITWTLPSVTTAGQYDISFGYRLSFDTPKLQFLNVNGTRIGEINFDGVPGAWLEKRQSVPLLKGSNTIQLELSWGWVDLDYLSVPGALTTNSETIAGIFPKQFSLEQNFPNPFNPSTVIGYRVSVKGLVQLVVYDLLGRHVARLVDAVEEPGTHSVIWDGRSDQRESMPSGIYFYRLTSGASVLSKKMVMLK